MCAHTFHFGCLYLLMGLMPVCITIKLLGGGGGGTLGKEMFAVHRCGVH
jgi:hypothetical protein